MNSLSAQEVENAAIKNAILGWLPTGLSEQPKRLEELKSYWQNDAASHEINFLRFGDFMCVLQSRCGQKTMKAIGLGREYYPVDPNNKGIQPQYTLRPASIELIRGKIPSMEGAGNAEQTTVYENGGGTEAKKFIIREIHEYSRYPGMYYSSQRPSVYIPTGIATPAVDDKINFHGAGVEILVPFGTGEKVFEDLLKALTVLQ